MPTIGAGSIPSEPWGHEPICRVLAPLVGGGHMSHHVREHRSVLGAVEKRLLVTIAAPLPASITPDHLTLLAFGSMCLAGLGYAVAFDDRRLLWLPIAA